MHAVTPVVLCGGSGTRLWPLSRTGFPKQFLCLSGSDSLFQQAAQRLVGMGTHDIQLAPLLVVAGEDHRFLLTEPRCLRSRRGRVHRLRRHGALPRP